MRMTSAGCSAPITVALATVVSLTAEKKNTRSRPRNTPPGAAARTSAHVKRRPVTNSAVTRTTAPTVVR